jgi:hypothetical protein
VKHIVQVLIERDLSASDENEVHERDGTDDNEREDSEGEEDEEGKEDEDDGQPITFQDKVCTLGPYDTLEEAETAADRVLKAFTRTERDKISFEFDGLEDEVGAILQVRDYLDTEEFLRRRKAGKLTAEELEEFDDD